MKIYLCCPECGDTNWIFRPASAGRAGEEPEFECGACGELCFPEDMGAVDSDGDELY